MAFKTLYTANAKAVGGRDGKVVTSDGVIDTPLSMPKSLGGAEKEGATNPEQLFAAGYSACFDSALNLVIRNQKVKTGTTTVEADVHLGQDESGFGLAVDLKVNIPEVDLETAQALAEAAHQVCPYSKATRGNIEVKVTATNN
ncbi:organic hydroperoxide resistance protein [Sediminitomix flava]|uniref:Ohr subfamily peroxiredoxin n=1 Tax=Sediminitomix flava TaxID=379075 RepID=A0A315Z9W0_SEDFL|nr:organic hydroperoxide resistance protein [Sediminitomix flava]PWJ40994.1 Ohr subfamily peroxiredoxin [Sediminitomix flava]